MKAYPVFHFPKKGRYYNAISFKFGFTSPLPIHNAVLFEGIVYQDDKLNFDIGKYQVVIKPTDETGPDAMALRFEVWEDGELLAIHTPVFYASSEKTLYSGKRNLVKHVA
jgi:hypothetical protein